MANTSTAIEWCDSTWSPVTGCTKVSAGCKNCYAEGVANRFWGDRKFTDVQMHEDRLTAPLRWKKSRRVFVNSMSDLFHDSVPDAFIDRVFAVMALATQHSFQVLTKRPERMREYIDSGWLVRRRGMVMQDAFEMQRDAGGERDARKWIAPVWPLPNVWLGVSVENQATADERIPIMLRTPAAIRFLSCEPLLGPVDLSTSSGVFNRKDAIRMAMNSPAHYNEHEADALIDYPVNWVICGGESGPRARPCDVAWIRSIVEQCKSAGVPAFVKQLGSKPIARSRYDMPDDVFASADANGWTESEGPRLMLMRDRKGGDMQEWAEDLRVREFPDVGEVAL